MAHAHDDDFEEPPFLRRLRLMVMVLIVVLILGVLAIAATIVIRLGFGVSDAPSATPVPISAEGIILPTGHDVIATGQGTGTVHFLMRAPDGSEALYLFDETTGREISRTPVSRQ